MGIEEVPAADQLPSDEAIAAAEKKVAAMQAVRSMRNQLNHLELYYQGEKAKLQAELAARARVYVALCGQAGPAQVLTP